MSQIKRGAYVKDYNPETPCPCDCCDHLDHCRIMVAECRTFKMWANRGTLDVNAAKKPEMTQKPLSRAEIIEAMDGGAVKTAVLAERTGHKRKAIATLLEKMVASGEVVRGVPSRSQHYLYAASKPVLDAAIKEQSRPLETVMYELLLRQALTIDEIAERLGIKYSTAKVHAGNLYKSGLIWRSSCGGRKRSPRVYASTKDMLKTRIEGVVAVERARVAPIAQVR